MGISLNTVHEDNIGISINSSTGTDPQDIFAFDNYETPVKSQQPDVVPFCSTPKNAKNVAVELFTLSDSYSCDSEETTDMETAVDIEELEVVPVKFSRIHGELHDFLSWL